jgi:hypothetical protein
MFRFSQATLDLKANLSKIAQHRIPLRQYDSFNRLLRVSRSILSSIGGSFFWKKQRDPDRVSFVDRWFQGDKYIRSNFLSNLLGE